ncbi:hypothetical protein DFJ73DRAFT_857894 [Zopfochytrium polystomum]|nr:hypothetical protein DFJ73DRAFT_857894 [Zopfochytrium polystomum]
MGGTLQLWVVWLDEVAWLVLSVVAPIVLTLIWTSRQADELRAKLTAEMTAQQRKLYGDLETLKQDLKLHKDEGDHDRVPIGSIVLSASTSENSPMSRRPDFHLCDGSIVTIGEYPELYSIIEDSYRDGRLQPEGTFYLPDMSDRYLRGSPSDSGYPRYGGSLEVQDGRAHVRFHASTSAAGRHRHKTTMQGWYERRMPFNGGLYTMMDCDSQNPSESLTDESGDHTHSFRVDQDATVTGTVEPKFMLCVP